MGFTFSAAVLVALNEPLVVEELVLPEILSGQVLVKNIASGICRSQLMEVSGRRGPDKWLPHLLGHEAVGIVTRIGEGVTKVKTGDKVIISWILGDGLTSTAPKFKSTSGETINSGASTTFSEYSVVPENRVYRAPLGFDDEFLPQFGCALLTGGGMVLSTFQMIPPHQSSKVLIIGFGGVGIAAALMAKSIEGLDIYIVDRSLERLEVASKLGFQNIFDSTDSLKEIFKEDEQGFDFCFESAGSVDSIELGFSLIKNSGILVFASHPESGKTLSLDPFELIKGKQIRGTWGGGISPDLAIGEIARRLLDTNLNLSLLTGPSFTLEEVNEGLSFLDYAGAGKPIIYFGEPK